MSKTIQETITIAKALEAAIADGAPAANHYGTPLTFCRADGCTHTGYYKSIDGIQYCPEHLAAVAERIAEMVAERQAAVADFLDYEI